MKTSPSGATRFLPLDDLKHSHREKSKKPTSFKVVPEQTFMIWFLVLLYCAFALTGILTALPGPWLPILSKKWMLTDAQAGSLIAAQFLGNALGCCFAIRRLRSSVLFGLAFLMFGAGGLAFLHWPILQAGFFCCGIGLGLTIPATNLLIANLSSQSRAISLNLLNCVWGVGAILCPALILIGQKLGSVEGIVFAVGLGAGILLLSLAAIRSWPDIVRRDQSPPGRAASLKHLMLFALLFFLYVGIETCIAGWIATYAQRRLSALHAFTLSPVTYFWAALVAGRAGSAYMLRRIHETALYPASLALGSGAFLLVLGGHSPAVIIVGIIVAGLALAPIFPLLVSFAAEPLHSRRNGGWVFACGAFGGSVLPWTTGKISTLYSLRAGFTVPVAALVTLLMLTPWLIRFTEKRTPLAASMP